MLTGSIFLGKAVKVKKDMGIFIDIGREKHALLRYSGKIKIGDFVIVQVIKEETENKGCAVTEKITIAGRYAVFNDLGQIKFAKSYDCEKQEALAALARSLKYGFIFRTNAINADVDIVKKECQDLILQYQGIKSLGKNSMKIQCLYRQDALKAAKNFAACDDEIVYDFSEVEKEIARISGRKVYADGVEIVVDKTEAMTVIDVNSHAFNKHYQDADTTYYNANLIAVKEIAKILRLRNIGGIIMVDFISMKNKELKEKLLLEFEKALHDDNVSVKVELIESLSLFAVVRKQRYGSV